MIVLAKSLAGHDKNHVYVIIKEETDLVTLVNGQTKTMEHPKIKKKMHVQVIKRLPQRVKDLLEEHSEMNDSLVSEILRLYQEEESCQKQM
ncbi:hypothetical protein SAMN02910453_1092 [Lachnospiraceae bacterium A10]|jgi:hypothetical protein|nr:hypothetical protein SAMN02910453_1092 [Lachnospiraceae bacterium A10]